MNYSSRRGVLLGSGALATSGLVGLSGCLDDLTDRDGDDEENGEESNGEEPLPSFHQWLHAPEALALDGYSYTYVEDDAIFNPDEYELRYGPGLVTETVRSTSRTAGRMLEEIESEAVDGAVSLTYGTEFGTTFGLVVTGGFDEAVLRSEYDDIFENDSTVERETYAGYTLYFDELNAVAIGEGTYVLGNNDTVAETESGRAIVEAILDAREGESPRLHTTDDVAETLLRQQGEQSVVFGAPAVQGVAEDAFRQLSIGADDTEEPTVTGGGVTLEVDDEPNYRVTVITEEAVSDPSVLEGAVPILEWFDEPSVTQDGTVLTYEANGDDESGDGGRNDAPQGAFEIDIGTDGEAAVVIHHSGDSVPADELVVSIEGENSRAYSWRELAGTETVAPGDYALIELTEADDGNRVVLLWEPEGMVLAEHLIRTDSSVPDATFDFDFDVQNGTGTVTHAGGDPIPADELDIVVESSEYRRLFWSEYSSDTVVEPGDAVTVDLTENDSDGAIVVWSNIGDDYLDYEYIPDIN